MVIFLLIAIGLSTLIFLFSPSTEQIHENIRRQWEAEERDHQVLRDAWNSERQAMVIERAAWQRERAAHNLERESVEAERERWRREREDHESRERREEEEKRGLLVWKDLKASTQCLRYGTREYSATLANVARGLDPVKECWNKSVDIHGRQVFPSRCQTEVRFFIHVSILKLNIRRVFIYRECAGLLGVTGMLTSTKLHVLPGGEGMTTRYRLIYMIYMFFFFPCANGSPQGCVEPGIHVRLLCYSLTIIL